jgi:hypothetical protein
MTSHEVIADFVFESMRHATIARRVQVSKAMAAVAATPGERKDWEAHVVALEAVENNLQQMWFQFQRGGK